MNTSRPVMVFIHGGFFTNQGTDQYPPNYLMERNIVLAVVGFRLDVIGEKNFFEKKIERTSSFSIHYN